MNAVTAIALAAFLMAIGIENVFVAMFLRQLRTRHPEQWGHALCAPGRNAWAGAGVYTVACYLRDYDFLHHADSSVIRFCRSRRLGIVSAYRATLILGVVLILCIAVLGW